MVLRISLLHNIVTITLSYIVIEIESNQLLLELLFTDSDLARILEETTVFLGPTVTYCK